MWRSCRSSGSWGRYKHNIDCSRVPGVAAKLFDVVQTEDNINFSTGLEMTAGRMQCNLETSCTVLLH